MKKVLLLLLVILTVLGNCNAQSVINNASAPTVSVSVFPTTVPLSAGTSQQFTATATNDFLNGGLSWTLSGPSCSGTACGTLSPSFLISGTTQVLSLSASSITYTAPASIPTIPVVNLTATSVQDNSRFATATINLTANPPPVIPQTVSALTSQVALAQNIFPISSTLGNNIVVGISFANNDTVSTVQACVTPTQCTNLTLTQSSSNATQAFTVAGYRGLGIPAGSTSIVVNNSVPNGTIAASYADLTNAGVFDTSTGINDQSGTNPAGPALTPSTTNEFIINFIATSGVVSSAVSPFSLSQGSAGFGFASSFEINSTTSPATPTYVATTGNWTAITMAFKPNASSGAPISVTLAPTSPTVQTSHTQPFTATVANDTASAGVNLTYVGQNCSGPTCGTGPSTAVSGTPFTYTAPSSIPGGSAISRVQHGSSNCNMTGGGSSSLVLNHSGLPYSLGVTSSTSMVLSGFTTVGNLEALAVSLPSNTMVITGATDNQGNTWVVRGSSTDSAGGNGTAILSTTTGGAAAGVTSITVSATNTFGFTNFALYDITINPSAFTFQISTASNQTTTTTPAGPAITPAGAGITIAVIADSTGAAHSIASPFTMFTGGFTAFDLNSGTSTLTPTWTISNGTWDGNTISIVEGSSGGSTPCNVSITSSPGGPADLLCAVASWSTPATGTLTVTDNKSQSYTNILNGPDYAMKCVFGGSSGVTQLTYAITTLPANVDVYYVEYAGMASLTPDQIIQNNSVAAGSTIFDSGPFSSAAVDTAGLLFGFAKNSSANTFTSGDNGFGGSYTKLDQQLSNGSAVQDFFTFTNTHAYKSIMTTDVAGSGEAFAVAFHGNTTAGTSGNVTLTATSVTDPTKSATANINLITITAPISVSINPTGASVQADNTQSFTPTITNDSGSNTVNWVLTGPGCSSTACGSISLATTASGAATVYTAPTNIPSPPSVTLTATDVTDPTKSAAVTISLFTAPQQINCSGGPCPSFSGLLGTASGGGAATVGGSGRNGTGTPVVIEVTNNNDSGTGSLRACVNASGPRTCIFRVAGLFPVTSGDIRFSSPFLTVAGQSAPGEVVLGGPNTNGALFGISTHDVILRFVTMSPDNYNTASGPDTGTTSVWIVNCPGQAGNLSVGGCFNLMIDHVTTRWSGNKSWITTSNFTPGAGTNGNGTGPNHNITTSWNLDYEPHEGHPVGYGTATDETCVGNRSNNNCLSPFEVNIDFHHNMLVNVHHRIPENSNGSTRWINNIIFNWGFYANEYLGAEIIDVINNKYIKGNLNALGAQPFPIHFTTNSPEMSGAPSVFVSGNIGGNFGANTVNSDQYGQLVQQITGENGDETGPIPGAWERGSPMAASNSFPIVPDLAANLDTILLPTVGDSIHLDCNGNQVSHRNSVDQRIIKQYQTGGSGGYWPNGMTDTGLINGQNGFTLPHPTANWVDPVVSVGTACVESLHDGIPDQWKTLNHLSTTDPTLWKTPNQKNGYTYLENYLNGMTP